MTQYLTRSAWTTTPKPVDKFVRFDTAQLKGIAVHYTGSTTPFGPIATQAQSASRLEAERQDHVENRGWADIAYNYAVDQAGRIFELRGLDYHSAANGDVPRNTRHGAVTFLIGAGDTPTAAAVEAFKDWHTSYWLPHWPQATQIIGHRDVYATDCPGDPLYALVRSGALGQPAAPSTPPEAEMLSKDDLKAIADELFSDAPDGAYYKVRRPDGTLVALTRAVSEMYLLLADLKTKIEG